MLHAKHLAGTQPHSYVSKSLVDHGLQAKQTARRHTVLDVTRKKDSSILKTQSQCENRHVVVRSPFPCLTDTPHISSFHKGLASLRGLVPPLGLAGLRACPRTCLDPHLGQCRRVLPSARLSLNMRREHSYSSLIRDSFQRLPPINPPPPSRKYRGDRLCA